MWLDVYISKYQIGIGNCLGHRSHGSLDHRSSVTSCFSSTCTGTVYMLMFTKQEEKNGGHVDFVVFLVALNIQISRLGPFVNYILSSIWGPE